jgi:hypothetical protein
MLLRELRVGDIEALLLLLLLLTMKCLADRRGEALC